ncbi:MerR family transcriptional regulator [Desulfosporosinus sp. BICA1-9]|uniref:MerR family transcriptional regulator n=1 Tax=Desulfosporosinus sp. BICA1-9 TaxID=1531958 RepID=UPI000ADC7A9C|nr:MerR family transcriptional regulator [Desulfosporosinus sp. BICA1-9]
MKENLLSITELAKLRKVTSETLRYYDRIGLIKPEYVDPQTKYRYYSIRQYEKLGTIRELRQLGMSLDDIVDYFTNRNLKKSITILEKHREILRREIKEKMLVNMVLRRKLRFLDELTSLPAPNVVFERVFSKRYMITFDEPAGGPREHAFAFTKLEWYLNETAPILASDRVGVYADEAILQKSDSYIPSSPMLLVEKDAIDSEFKKAIPAGLYLCMYYHNGGLEEYHESFEIIKDYMKKHRICINGNIFQIYKLDVTLTSDPMETIMEIQVPVKKI